MKNFKIILKGLAYSFIIFIILSLVYTIISYFNLFSFNVNNIIKFIVPLLCFAIGGFLVGKKALKNGWLEGIKISGLFSIIMIIITIFLKQFKVEYFLYILILMIAGVFGSMIGINRKI